jgi:GntR family histidine utilization transcriptional repressor
MGIITPTRRAIAIPSLHERILGDIEGRILTGEWAPGVRIPFEHELSAQYQCSRMTVNKALSELARAGWIERRRKVGSFVLRAPSRSAVLEIPDVKVEVAALGADYRFEILNRRQRRAIRTDAGRLEGVGAGQIIDLTCRHWAGKRPFCLEERLINLSATPEAADETFSEIAPGAWLLARAPWTRAEHRIRALAADSRRAGLLEVAEATACLSIERRTWSGEAAVTHVRLTYPGEAHELIARFSPSQR